MLPADKRKGDLESLVHTLELPEELIGDVQRLADHVSQTVVQRQVKLIGVASAHPGEGTSTIAALLGLLMAAKRGSAPIQEPTTEALAHPLGGVLLIDANLRRPVLDQLFEVEGEAGLSDWLDGDIRLGESLLSEVIERDLMLLNAGSTRDELAALHFEFERCGPIFEQLKAQFHYVIVDLPPLLQATEARTLCQLCDGIVLVVQSNKTRRGVVEAAAQTLAQAKCPLLGTVLNRRQFYIPDSIYRRL